MIDIDENEILDLNEDKCHMILDTLVKNAYGPKFEISISDIDKYVHIHDECKISYYILGYDGNLIPKFVSFTQHGITWKNVLQTMIEFIKKHGEKSFVSYLPTEPHLLDHKISLEKIIINLDLSSIE